MDSSTPTTNNFYRDHYYRVVIGLIGAIFLMLVAISVVLYQTLTRPLPDFYAQQPDNQRMPLVAYQEPNLLPDTILSWAKKAATLSYTFGFDTYNDQLAMARPYFTDAGWTAYRSTIRPLLNRIVENQIFVYGIVAGAPVISNEGELPGVGYSWRVQIPFLVTYQASRGLATKQFYTVLMTIVKVPTEINPQGIGIDQFVMV
jgi:intracellular multiplication protein IcmL